MGNGLELAVWKCFPSAAPEGERLNQIKLSRTHARTKITSEKYPITQKGLNMLFNVDKYFQRK